MQGGFKGAGREEEDDDRARTQEGLEDAPGLGGSGTPAQGRGEEDLGVLR